MPGPPFRRRDDRSTVRLDDIQVLVQLNADERVGEFEKVGRLLRTPGEVGRTQRKQLQEQVTQRMNSTSMLLYIDTLQY